MHRSEVRKARPSTRDLEGRYDQSDCKEITILVQRQGNDDANVADEGGAVF